MTARWVLAPRRPEVEAVLSRELAVSPRLARLLAARGIEAPEAALGFLEAKLSRQLRSPMLFRDMPAAAERMAAALRNRERIGIFGDYDVDGMSGSALLVVFLRELGHDPALYIPDRVRDGYGLNERGVRALAEQGTRLMVTVDCGGSAHGEIEAARRSGIDTIVCDHHQVSGRPLPARANLNPMEPDAGFPFRGLCGAGVVFYLLLGTRMKLRESGAGPGPDLRRGLDLVALGTVADIVPILEENRVLVKHGLKELETTARPGLAALKAVSGVSEVSTGAIGFRLAPRLNAAGRLGDATRGVELLVTGDAERARVLAEELDAQNRARQAIEDEILTGAMARVERDGIEGRRSVVLASRDWHPGVVGIVAARMVERLYRPVALIALNAETGIGRGSCRGIRGVHLFEALKRCAGVLEGFGGHRMAAGLTVREDNVPRLAEEFEAAVRAGSRPDDFIPRVDIDDELRLAEVDDVLLADIERLEPFGAGNPEPVFLCRDATVLSRRVVGQKHLRLLLEQNGRRIGAIAFGHGESVVAEGDRIDVAGIPESDDWNGGVQFRIKRMRRSDSGRSTENAEEPRNQESRIRS